MRRLACTLAFALAAASPTHARPPNPREAPQAEPTSETEKVNAAIQAWGRGDWARVRTLLDPLLRGGAKMSDPLLEETALRYLTDATLNDESLESLRIELASEYLNRLLDSSPDWRPPEIHTKPFYELYNRLREERSSARINACLASGAECTADKAQLQARFDALTRDHTSLQRAFSEQEVEVREKVARNRAVAMIPFGVGHFYNGRKVLGAIFLSAEAVVGGAGLGLLLFRISACDRSRGYRPGSLSCQGERDKILAVRNGEQALGIAFFSLLALDILIAQVTFRPFVTVKKTRVRRNELDKIDEPRGRRQGGQPPGQAPAGPPRARLRTHDILQASPAPAFFPGGGGLGVHVRF